MSVKADWVEQFRVSPENLDKWRAEVGPRADLLRWCLLNGKITESDYLQWACEHYEMPVVEAQYFSLPPDTDFWEKVRTSGPWTESLFPLQEWQGTWLIACIEPLANAKFAKPHRFVLSSARALDMLWRSLNHNLDRSNAGIERTATATIPYPAENPDAAAASPPPLESAPDGLAAALASMGTGTAPGEALPDGFNVKDLFASDPSPAPEPDFGEVTAGPASEAPDGLAALADSVASEGTDVSAPSADAPPAEALASLNFEIPSAFGNDNSQEAERSRTHPQPPLKSEELPLVAVPSIPLPPQITPAMPKAPPKVDANFARETTGVASTSKVILPVPNGLEPPPARVSVDLSPPEVDKVHGRSASGVTDFTKCVSLEDVSELAFSKMQGTFQKSIMLVFQGGQLRPWKWTGTVPYTGKGKPNALDLEPASIFKIVYATALPYHGYIVPNPTNNAFFAEFNAGVTPAHVTIMPILVSGHIAGMLMGMTDTPLDLKAVLRQMESLTDAVGKALTRIRAGKAA